MNIVKLRKEEKKTQAEIANYLKIAKSTYNNYEQQVCEPNINTLIKLADYYHVSVDYLIGRDFANDVGYMTPNQKEVVKIFLSLDEFNQAKATGYITGLSLER